MARYISHSFYFCINFVLLQKIKLPKYMKGGNIVETTSEKEEVLDSDIGVYISFFIHTYVL